jgi:katanin p60 ATPase-containing subunit A1
MCIYIDITLEFRIFSITFLAVMTVMELSVNEISENTKLAREMAVMGNYDVAGIYYQGVIQQIHKLLIGIADSTRKGKWQLVSNVHKVVTSVR